MTGLSNRTAILRQMEREVSRAQREGTVLAVAIGDLDHFGRINDADGQVYGGEVLREVAQRLAGCLRTYDSIGRYGGEEFLILMPGYDPVENPTRLEDLVTSLQGRSFLDDGSVVRTSGSFGATAFRPYIRPFSMEEILATADRALHQARAVGRNCAQFVELTDCPGIVAKA